jgi:hypothetical protein
MGEQFGIISWQAVWVLSHEKRVQGYNGGEPTGLRGAAPRAIDEMTCKNDFSVQSPRRFQILRRFPLCSKLFELDPASSSFELWSFLSLAPCLGLVGRYVPEARGVAVAKIPRAWSQDQPRRNPRATPPSKSRYLPEPQHHQKPDQPPDELQHPVLCVRVLASTSRLSFSDNREWFETHDNSSRRWPPTSPAGATTITNSRHLATDARQPRPRKPRPPCRTPSSRPRGRCQAPSSTHPPHLGFNPAMMRFSDDCS